MARVPKHKIHVNYIYFGFLFIGFALLHSLHVFSLQPVLQFFFIGDVIFQSFLETAILLLIWNVLNEYVSRKLALTFIACTFLLLALRLMDFSLVRLVDMSVWFVLEFLSQESLENFVEMLFASDVHLSTWFLGAVVGCCFLAAGVVFFYLSERVTRKKALYISYATYGKAFCVLIVFLFSWDVAETHFSTSKLRGQCYKMLPWKRSLFLPQEDVVSLPCCLKDPIQENLPLESLSFDLKHKPDIFLFVVESLREDFITKDIAPSLDRFKKECTPIHLAISSANATQKSWFSIFYSQHSFYWSKARKARLALGAPALRMFKQMGYEINVYSSSRLSYYKMDEVLFGKKHHLADTIHYFNCHELQPHWESDGASIASLCQEASHPSKKEGRLFIVFLESTHFDYSWPAHLSTFAPIVDKINYFKIAFFDEDVEKIRNRYRNAVHYVDALFGSFETALRKADHWKDSIVIVTGDHGEEFYEQGHIFHASQLSDVQMRVPIYCKFNGFYTPCEIASHIDIFPTLFHVLLGENHPSSAFFGGKSLFQKEKQPFAVTARYNASRSPYEFCIHNGSYKMVARFSNEKQIFQANKLNLLTVRDRNDEPVHYDASFVEKEFGPALKELFAE